MQARMQKWGNSLALRIPKPIAEQAKRRTGKQFGQIILAAPDVDADVFRQRCWGFMKVAARTTLYVSTKDIAIGVSKWLHQFPRAGLMPPVMIVPPVTSRGHGPRRELVSP